MQAFFFTIMKNSNIMLNRGVYKYGNIKKGKGKYAIK